MVVPQNVIRRSLGGSKAAHADFDYDNDGGGGFDTVGDEQSDGGGGGRGPASQPLEGTSNKMTLSRAWKRARPWLLSVGMALFDGAARHRARRSRIIKQHSLVTYVGVLPTCMDAITKPNPPPRVEAGPTVDYASVWPQQLVETVAHDLIPTTEWVNRLTALKRGGSSANLALFFFVLRRVLKWAIGCYAAHPDVAHLATQPSALVAARAVKRALSSLEVEARSVHLRRLQQARSVFREQSDTFTNLGERLVEIAGMIERNRNSWCEYLEVDAVDADCDELRGVVLAALCGYADMPALRIGVGAGLVAAAAAAPDGEPVDERRLTLFVDSADRVWLKVFYNQKDHAMPAVELRQSEFVLVRSAALTLVRSTCFVNGISIYNSDTDGTMLALLDAGCAAVGLDPPPMLFRDSTGALDYPANGMRRLWSSLTWLGAACRWLDDDQAAALILSQLHDVRESRQSYVRFDLDALFGKQRMDEIESRLLRAARQLRPRIRGELAPTPDAQRRITNIAAGAAAVLHQLLVGLVRDQQFVCCHCRQACVASADQIAHHIARCARNVSATSAAARLRYEDGLLAQRAARFNADHHLKADRDDEWHEAEDALLSADEKDAEADFAPMRKRSQRRSATRAAKRVRRLSQLLGPDIDSSNDDDTEKQRECDANNALTRKILGSLADFDSDGDGALLSSSSDEAMSSERSSERSSDAYAIGVVESSTRTSSSRLLSSHTRLRTAHRSTKRASESDIGADPDPLLNIAGLPNSGNMCYMNALLQALAAVSSVRLAAAATVQSRAQVSTAAHAFFRTLFLLHNRTATVGAEITRTLAVLASFADTVGLIRGRQHDTHEMLLALLTLSDVSAVLMPLFNVQFAQVTIYNCEHRHASRIDTQTPTLELALGNKQLGSSATSLQQLLDQHLADATLSDLLCTDCDTDTPKRCTGEQSVVITNPPRVLTLTLKRYTYDERGNTLSHKRAVHLESRELRYGGVTYAVRAIVVHQGDSPRAGHYYSYVAVDDNWIYCSDMTVRHVQAFDRTQVATNAYVYLFEMCD